MRTAERDPIAPQRRPSVRNADDGDGDDGCGGPDDATAAVDDGGAT